MCQGYTASFNGTNFYTYLSGDAIQADASVNCAAKHMSLLMPESWEEVRFLQNMTGNGISENKIECILCISLKAFVIQFRHCYIKCLYRKEISAPQIRLFLFIFSKLKIVYLNSHAVINKCP